MAKKREDKIELYMVKIPKKKRYWWRWRRVAPNGEIVGASTEAYARRIQCFANAKRHFEPVRIYVLGAGLFDPEIEVAK